MQSITRPENALFALELERMEGRGRTWPHGRWLPLFRTMCFDAAAAAAGQ